MPDTPTLQFDPDRGGLHVDLPKLVAGRMLIQGSSGAGKSWLARYILEQTHGRIQHFVFDPEGEFASLREHFDYVVASADPEEGDVPADPKSAKLLCRQLVELGASAVLDIYELDEDVRQEFVGRFLSALVNLPKRLWSPALVVLDEAHEFAPETGAEPVSRRPVERMCSKGRKRGLGAIYLTQRLSKLSKNASDLQNILVGYTGLDVDVKRSGDILGFDKAQREGLKRLEPGEFYAFGPAIAKEVTLVRSGEIQTHHPKPGEIRPPTPPPRGKIRALLSQLEDIPERAAEEERTIEALEGQVRDLRTRLRKAERSGGTDPKEVERRARAAAAQVRAELEPRVDHLEGKLDKVADHADILLGAAKTIGGAAAGIVELVRNGDGPPAKRPVRKPPPRKREPEPEVAAAEAAIAEAVDRKNLGGGERKVLDALAILESMGIEEAADENVAAFAGYTHSGGTYQNYRGALRSKGLIEYRGNLRRLTGAGRALARYPDRPPTLEALHEAWFDLLPGPHGALLRELIDIYPEDMTSEELAERTGYTASGGTFQNYRGRLSSLGLAEYPVPGRVRAADLLFPAGLT